MLYLFLKSVKYLYQFLKLLFSEWLIYVFHYFTCKGWEYQLFQIYVIILVLKGLEVNICVTFAGIEKGVRVSGQGGMSLQVLLEERRGQIFTFPSFQKLFVWSYFRITPNVQYQTQNSSIFISHMQNGVSLESLAEELYNKGKKNIG